MEGGEELWRWVQKRQWIAEWIVGVLVLVVISWVRKKKISPNLPPGPPAVPIIGHLHLLARNRLPHLTLTNLAKQYGPLMRLKLGPIETVLVSSPAMAREILKIQDQIFCSRPNILMGELFYHNQDIILSPYNDHWRFLRKIVTMELLTFKRIAQFQDVRREEILKTVGRMISEGREGKLIILESKAMELSFNSITRTLFREAYYGEYHLTSEGARKARDFDAIIRDLTSVGYFNIGEIFPSLRRFDIGGVEAKFKKIESEFDRFLSAILEERRSQLRSSASDHSSGQSDFLQLLLAIQSDDLDGGYRGLTDVQIKSLLKDMILGGSETIASSLTWVLAELMRHPDVRRRVLDELDAVVGMDRVVEEEDLRKLPYLKAVVKESFRLHPLLPLLIPHESLVATTLGGYDIPAKTRVFINTYALGIDPETWGPSADAFDPDRFQMNHVELKGQDFMLLPFGSGRRICPGMNLGLLMVEISLAQILHNCDLALPPGMVPADVSMDATVGSTIHLSHPLELRVRPRLPSHVFKAAGITVA